jgi:methylmalonyl-CoA mutase
VLAGVYSGEYEGDPQFDAMKDRVAVFQKSYGRSPAIFIAKMGQDGHDRGAKVIATAFADLGFSVHMGGLFDTPQEVAVQAGTLGVDAVGVSSLAAGHKTLVPELIAALRERELGGISVFVGGVIPSADYDFLLEAGVAEIFGPGSNVLDAAFAVLDRIEGRLSNR